MRQVWQYENSFINVNIFNKKFKGEELETSLMKTLMEKLLNNKMPHTIFYVNGNGRMSHADLTK